MTSHAARAYIDFPAAAGAFTHRAAIVVLLARRAIWMTALARVAPWTSAAAAMAAEEIALLDRLAHGSETSFALSTAVERLAELGGASAASPRFLRVFAVARGLSRIADVQIARRLRAAKYLDRV